MTTIHRHEERRAVLRIVAFYAIFGSLWIYTSDSVVELITRDPFVMTKIAMYKGLLFIVVTSSLLYFLISRYVGYVSEKNRLLKISEERFQSIFHGISDAVFIHDAATGSIINVNRTACEMFGYPADEIVAMGVAEISLGTPPYSQNEAIEWLNLAAQGTPQKFKWHCRRNGGITFWAEINMKAEVIGDERCIIVSVRDITDRIQTDRMLQQSHSMLQNLSLQVPGVLFQTVLSAEGHYSTPYASDKLYEIYELFPDDIRQDTGPVFDRFHPDDRGRILESIEQSVTTLTRWECEYRVLLPRQGLKWLYGTAQSQRQPDGSIVMYGIIMDITGRKKAEEKLRLSEAKFATAFRASPDAVNLTRRSDGTYLEVNGGFTAITGYLSDEVIGKTAIELNIWVDPQDRVRLIKELDEHGIVRNLEAQFRRKDGTTLIGHMSACTIDINGEKYILSITRDVTEREIRQQEFLKMQKLESLGVLAGGIAHDFNNILTGIMGNISFARMFLDESHRSYNILINAEKASQRATDLAHQLLTFAKGGQPVKKTVSAQQIIESSASLALRGSNVLYTITIPDNLQAVEIDEGQIHQAFNNIFINAAQAMPSGGTITVTAENVTMEAVNFLSLPAGKYVRFTFTDTGCGMTDEVRKRIFDPYFTTKAGGNGLGLASVYSIINRHGGHISVQSERNKGTSFVILLPASAEPAALADINTPMIATADPGVGSVLIMDDEDMIRDMASEMLKELGYQVTSCADGDEAIALYKEAKEAGNPFSAVIMDLTIPGGMGGKEAAERILELDPSASLIVSSGYSNDPVVSDFTSHGFCATVLKPYSLSELARVLQGCTGSMKPATRENR